MSAKKLCGRLPGGGAIRTVSVIGVVAERLDDVPCTVIVAAPVGADPLMVNVSVLPLLVLAGLNAAATPDGSPVAERVTLPENPPLPTTPIATAPVAACCKITLDGEDVREKPGGSVS